MSQTTTQITTGRRSGRQKDDRAADARHIDAVMDVLIGAAAGTGGAVVLHDGTGVDGRRLLHAVLRTWPHTALLRRCTPTDRDRHLGLFRDAVAVGLPTVITTADLILERLEDVLAAGPLLLALDDVQWADDASIAVLHRLTVDVVRRPLALLITVPAERRPAGLGRLLASLVDQGALTEVRRTVGTSDRLMLATEPGLDQPQPPMPAVDGLSPRTKDVLQLAGLLGNAFTARELCMVAGLGMTELLPSIQEAIAAGLLEETDDERLTLRSDRLGDLAAEDLPAAVRSELHRDLARRLDQEGAAAAVVATHLLRAGVTARDVEWLTETASRLQVADPATGIALWERAVNALEPHDDRRSRAGAGLAEALLAGGRFAEAGAVAQRTLATGARAGLAGRLRFTVTAADLWQGRWAAARAGGKAAGEAPELHAFQRAEQLAMASTAALLSGHPGDLPELLDQAHRLAVRAGAPQARAQVLAVCAHRAHLRADLDEAERLFAESRALTGHRDPRAIGLPEVGHALVLADMDRMQEAHALLTETVAECRASGWRPGSALSLMAQGVLHAECGALDRAVDALEESGSTLVGRDGAPHPFAVAHLAEIALHRQGPAAASERLASLPAGLLGTVGHLLGHGAVVSARAAVLLEEGDEAGWARELGAGWFSCLRAGLVPDLVLLAPDVADAAYRAGDVTLRDSVVEVLSDTAARNPGVATISASAAAARALVGSDVEPMLDAVAAWRRSPRTLRSAHVAERVAQRLVDVGGPRTVASDLGRYASAVYLAAGAAHAAQRVCATVRTSRSALRSSGRVRHTVGWAALTRTERVVAGYVERGESNAQIAEHLVVSRRTVETHVSHILAKLRLRSRAELIVAAAQRGRLSGQLIAPDAPVHLTR